jgi:single-strand DNA-binding protein
MALNPKASDAAAKPVRQVAKTLTTKTSNQLINAMANLNRVLLFGNVTRDPELRYTPKGTPVTEIGVAINRVYTAADDQKQQEVMFVEVELWSRLAEVACNISKKGRLVFVEGRLRLKSWDDKKSGQKRSRMIVVGENLRFLSDRTGIDSDSSQAGGASAHGPDLKTEPEDIPFATRIYKDVKTWRGRPRVSL